jgi:hypothetical protein
MKRTLLVLFSICLFLIPGLLYAQVEDEPGLVNPGVSPEVWDSLMTNKNAEPTLQHLLDSLGYDIDVVNDLLPTEVWATIAGQYSEVVLAEFAGLASQTSSGWYGQGSPADTHVIFRGANIPGDTAFFTITGCNSYGLFIYVPGAGEKCPPYFYYTEKWLNPDHKDHAKVYCSKKRPNEFIIAWEDCLYLGDQDFNDLVLVVHTPNRAPVLDLPENMKFILCETDTVCFDINAYDDCGDTISIAKLKGPGIFDQDAGTCCFLPASVDSAYEFVFVATDCFGAADTDTVVITVEYNQPPQIVCPDDDSVNAGDRFVSSNFSTSDPKCDPVVNLCGITPTPVHMPYKVQRHVEWQTDCADAGKVFTICLEATDKCGAKDTCYFEVTVYNRPPQIICPDDDSVYAGDRFVSSNFSTSDPKCDPIVNLCGISPTPTHMPIKVSRHVEWLTDCADAGKVFIICLEATDKCGAKDTCYFEVTVYNRPPQITCPDDTSINGGDTLVSTDFSVTDPDGDSALVTFLDINPSAPNNPTIVENHVEWVTTGNDNGRYLIRLVATDPCGAKDTCEFTVNVNQQDFTISATPEDQYVIQGHLMRYLVKLTSLFGFDDPCTLFVSGLPDPPDSGVFDQSILTPTDSTGLNVYTTPATDTGSYTLTITAQAMSGGKATPLEHSVQVVLRVMESSDVGDEADNPNSPKSFALFQNQPNPFNPETKISYYLPKTCEVKITIYNILGENIRILFNGRQDAGMQTLFWDGKDKYGVQQSSGIYFYRMQAGKFTETKRMVLMK